MNVVLQQQMKLLRQWDLKQPKKALEMANLDPQEIELIIVATTSGSHAYPSSACQVQGLLGIEDAISFDLAAACTGFVYALGVADKFIRSGSVKKALVIGADLNSRKLDETDRSTVVLFGDGAGAVILEASEQEGIISTHYMHRQITMRHYSFHKLSVAWRNLAILKCKVMKPSN